MKEILDGGKAEVFRVFFNEITPKAIRSAVENPGRINQHIVDAQQARRILDRLVGYQVSPLLWDKVKRGLSAGRVQTVALRLIVEREHQINAFQPVEYWNIDAVLRPVGIGGSEFTARMVGVKGNPIRVANGTDADGKEQYLANALPDQAAVEPIALCCLERVERAHGAVDFARTGQDFRQSAENYRVIDMKASFV